MQNPEETSALDATVTDLPNNSRAKVLVGCRWSRIEVQGGRLSHESRRFPGAWSTASLRVHAGDDVLVHAESCDYGGVESFGLRIRLSAEPWSAHHIESARPSFGTMLKWPVGLNLPPQFSDSGPDSGEAGLGQAVRTSTLEASVPLLWLVLRAGNVGLLLFADWEIPLNVGIANLDAMETVAKALRAASIVKL